MYVKVVKVGGGVVYGYLSWNPFTQEVVVDTDSNCGQVRVSAETVSYLVPTKINQQNNG